MEAGDKQNVQRESAKACSGFHRPGCHARWHIRRLASYTLLQGDKQLTAQTEISLQTYTAQKKWTVLVFIPMAWTFVCPTEIVAFSNATTQFSSRGVQVVICSTDSEYSLLAWRNTAQKDGGLGPVDIPLLSDKNHQISRDYGVLIEEEGIALRGMFLIDPLGS